jgi:hypothetical protein
MKKGCLYFHQGWTDIINCLPLINYYAKTYEEVVVVIREDSKPILDYYINGLNNVKMFYAPKYVLDSSMLNLPPDIDVLYHGYHDKLRKDKYAGKFDEGGMYFVKGFYEFYEIPFINKVNCFELKRNKELEETKYKEFVEKYGEDYILFHDDQNTPGGSTGINLNDILADRNNAVNLNSITTNVFDYVKVLENAKEIHLVDSIWAATCYLLDSKYELFKDKTVNLYAFKTRGGGLMEKYDDKVILPLHPSNWLIKNI